MGELLAKGLEGGNPDPDLTRAMSKQTASDGGSVTLLKADGSQTRLSVHRRRAAGSVGRGRGRQRQRLDIELRHAEQPDHAVVRRAHRELPPGFKTYGPGLATAASSKRAGRPLEGMARSASIPPSSSTAFQVYAVCRATPTACAACAAVLPAKSIRPARKRRRTVCRIALSPCMPPNTRQVSVQRTRTLSVFMNYGKLNRQDLERGRAWVHPDEATASRWLAEGRLPVRTGPCWPGVPATPPAAFALLRPSGTGSVGSALSRAPCPQSMPMACDGTPARDNRYGIRMTSMIDAHPRQPGPPEHLEVIRK